MTIAGVGEGIKAWLSRIPIDALFMAALLLTATGSFGLGLLAGQDLAERGREPIQIEQRELTGAAASAVAAEEPPAPQPTPASGGQYVASKNGTAYYLPWCGGASRINDENKVWFSSKAEAEAAGYRPAKTCKGI